MGKLVLDKSILEKLAKLTEAVELTDDSGKVFGRFVPQPTNTNSEYPYPEIPLTRSQIDSIKASRSGRPLSEIWKSLGRK